MNNTYRDACLFGKACLTKAGIPEADLEARLLLEYVCGTDRSFYYAHPDYELTQEEKARYEALCMERANSRIPLAYLTGTQGFMGLDFFVNPQVLIPRQDTETLVEEARRHLHDGMRFLDLCTGSGCVALSLAFYSNDTTGVATDISEKALEVAKKNALHLAIERISFVCCDLFPGRDAGTFDLIVSNPPYIRTGGIAVLQPEVAHHEPLGALDGGNDGLDFYRRIVREAGAYLIRGGWLIVEIGYDQEEDVRRLFTEAGFSHVEMVRDAGGCARVIKGCFYV